VIFVAILLVRLRNNATGLILELSLPEHPGVLGSGPLLKRGEAEPLRRPVLVPIVHGMIGCQMMVRIRFVKKCPDFMGPVEIAVQTNVIAKIPGDIRISRKPVCCILEIAMLVRAIGSGMTRESFQSKTTEIIKSRLRA
jgi:hypothetical protein